MEVLISLLVGLLFGVGVYLLQQRTLFHLVIASSVISHAANLLLITVGRLKRGAAPILSPDISAYTDPLPHALILTAIVIGFGVTAFTLVIAYRTYQEFGTDDLAALLDPEEQQPLVKANREAAAHDQ